MYKIDEEQFAKGVLQFKDYVVHMQEEMKEKLKIENPTKIEFDKGWIDYSEGYKHRFLGKAAEILCIDCWNESNLMDMNVTQKISNCWDIPMDSFGPNNLLDYHDKIYCQDLFEKDCENAASIIYQIICGDNEQQAFEDATLFFGKRYSIISFLFFLKNIRKENTYVHVRPKHMKKNFEILGISAECLHSATWENYREYCTIMRDIENRLKSEFDKVDIIDAHSFVWLADVAEEYAITDQTGQLFARFEEIEQQTEKLEILGSEREVIRKARVNHSKFRELLCQRYEHCCLCGVAAPELLVASHIQPWCKSNSQEKVDIDNGFLFCPNHDWLFDRGWISFDEDGEILISDKLSQNNRQFMNIHEHMHIKLTEGNKKYLKYHRENIFENGKEE